MHIYTVSFVVAPEFCCSSRVRWSPFVRAELLKTTDNKLPCQIMIVAVGAAAAGNQSFIARKVKCY